MRPRYLPGCFGSPGQGRGILQCPSLLGVLGVSDLGYLINKVPCRLRDITDMFADTGLGARSYSVIQQHMIDAVISDKAEERRFLFEEAAGITKYKQRRKAALRKLEATENDFPRNLTGQIER